MKARSVAREIALFTLFQMDEKGQFTLNSNSFFREQVLETVRSLTSMAEEEIASSAKAISNILYELEDYELAHPANEKLRLHEPINPVPLPTSKDLRDKLHSLLRGLENLNEAMDLPEIHVFSQREEVQNYCRMLVKTVVEHREEIDRVIDEASEQWRVNRMHKMDLNILRLGVAELLFTNQAEPATVIDETLNLANRFIDEESRRFVHGILRNIYEQRTSQGVAS